MKPYHETEHGVLYHGDCLQVMKQFEDKSFDLCLTDPPYGLNKKIHDGGTWAKKDKFDDCLEWDFALTLDQIMSLCNKAKNSIVWGGNYYSFPASRCWLVWVKPNFPTMSDCELAWTSFDMNTKKFNHSRNDGYKDHPTQKPVKLFEWCLLNYSKEQQLILDPFAGSGTTAIACIRTNRRYVMIEKEEKYCEIAAKRIESELDQTDIFRSDNA